MNGLTRQTPIPDMMRSVRLAEARICRSISGSVQVVGDD